MFFLNSSHPSHENSLFASRLSYGYRSTLTIDGNDHSSQFRNSRGYFEQVIESFYDYLLRLDPVRGTGRLYLP